MKMNDSAVSPVIGVMLMLIVTLVVAAVVSGFAGGLIGNNNQKAPNLAMDIKVSNTGTWIGSGFSATVTGVSEPIKTQDLKMVTSWRTTDRINGTTLTGGSVCTPGVTNAVYYGMGKNNPPLRTAVAPFGFGSGITGAQNPTDPGGKTGEHFGNYTFVQGTGLSALPYGSHSGVAIGGVSNASDDGGYGVATAYLYTTGPSGWYTIGTHTDPTQAVLGKGWENLKPGDIVSVKVVHIPTGKTIFQKDVAVTEG